MDYFIEECARDGGINHPAVVMLKAAAEKLDVAENHASATNNGPSVVVVSMF